MKTEDIEQEALRIFRVVHGKGDSGSKHAFDCQNPAIIDGWMRLARQTLRDKITNSVFVPLGGDHQ